MDEFLLIFIAIVLYVILLFIIRHLGLGSKENCIHCNNCCPDCSLALNRIKRINRDKILYHITFRVFEFKRYSCQECGWEGLKWEKKYSSNQGSKHN